MNTTNEQIIECITNTYKTNSFWEILTKDSAAKSGPFDGACLICANAIIMAFGSGDLVRVVNTHKGNVTEHFGARINGQIFDMEGGYRSDEHWLRKFSEYEHIPANQLTIQCGKDALTEIVQDRESSLKVAGIMKNKLSVMNSLLFENHQTLTL